MYRHVRTLILCIALLAGLPLGASNPVDSLKKEIKVSGSAGFNTISYNTSRAQPSRSPFSYNFFGNLNISGYGINVPLSFIYSEQERKFSQPFNQFGISPQYKWLTVHLGYRNLTYSKYSLAGHTFLGVGVDMNPGKFRFSGMYGRFDRAVTSALDSLIQPRYQRNGYSFKLGYGTDNDHFDLILMSIKDVPKSLTALADTTKVKPAENAVVGINFKKQLFKYFSVEYDYGLSVYTDNTNAEKLRELAAKNGVNIPAVDGFVTPRINSRYFQAMEGGLAFTQKLYGLKLIYKRIDPGYKSMGAYEMNTDLENITLNPRVSIWKQRISLSGSVGYQHDNIIHKKRATTTRFIGSASINISPKPHYGIAAQYSNYSTSQSPGIKVINDTLRLAQVSKSISLTPRYMIAGQEFTHLFMVVWFKQTLTDNNNFTKGFSQYQTSNYNLIYSININKSSTGFNVSYNLSKTEMFYGITQYSGVSAGATQAFFENKLSSNINFTFNKTSSGASALGNIYNVRLGSSYRIKRNTLNLNIIYLNNHSSSLTNPSFKETTATFGYNYSF